MKSEVQEIMIRTRTGRLVLDLLEAFWDGLVVVVVVVVGVPG